MTVAAGRLHCFHACLVTLFESVDTPGNSSYLIVSHASLQHPDP
jgi:hypothetical protein